ncbi:hypothetical protein AGOR_G00025890 [Albula goreensis]|uniref:C-type lectin domain-containing protein n=1 Tax=Albula goreensis TaxID=1534307 RepID=A0A8T3E3W5_9TELE|nr:hypothetical protein AGOR_G00025890 [Albula goreensis]
MESAQKNDAPQRLYEDLISPESVYHSLHFQNPGGNKTALGPVPIQKGPIVAILLSVLSILSLSILVIVAIHYSKAPKLPSVSKPGSELWHLQDNIFYLSWHGPGNCQSAEAFCRKRNATLAISYQHNRDWMMSLTSGMQMWVQAETKEDSSGSGQIENEVLCSCVLFSAPEAAHCGAYHGWVCEKRAYWSQTDNDMFSE